MKRAIQHLWAGMVTHNKLDGLGSNLVGVIFSVPIETGPGAHPPHLVKGIGKAVL
jgi:hypothetical protein